jgi:glucans biosynthesis protein
MADPFATPSRRDLIARAGLLGAALAFPGSTWAAPRPLASRLGPPQPFEPAALLDRARQMASRPYVARAMSASAAANYDAHVRLSYGAAEQLPGHIRLFPARRDIGAAPVGIHLVSDGKAQRLLDTTGLFAGGAPADPAGFRVMYADGHADWLAFLGASYFRAAGSHDQFGLSARAIAVDTGMGAREEFPAFIDFWIEPRGDQAVRIHALLDGPSLSGVFAIDTRHEAGGTIQDVTGSVFLRRDVARLGWAPMTSMYLFGDDKLGAARQQAAGDPRLAVHDSDGLAIRLANGERLWRPLDDPPVPRTNAFRADTLRGYGLLQRDQAYDHYRDNQRYYDRRPSLWMEPHGDWGKGSIMLYAFPTISENVDNIAAFWIGDAPARAGQRHDRAYRLTWSSQVPGVDDNARVMHVHAGPAPIAGATRYVFTFQGKALAGLTPASGVRAITDLPAQTVLEQRVAPLAGAPDVWQVTLDVRTQVLDRNEFRLFLQCSGGALSETVIKSLAP